MAYRSGCFLLTLTLFYGKLSLAQVKVGDHLQGGIVYRVDKSGRHGWIVSDADIRDSVRYDEALKMCDTLTIGGKKGWKMPSGNDWDEFNGQPGILGLVISGKLKLDHWYYWEYSALASSTSALARTVKGDYHDISFLRKKSRIPFRPVRQF